MTPIQLVFVEGHLERPAAMRLLKAASFETEYIRSIVAGGREAFWLNAPRYNTAAANLGYIFALTDLDDTPCVPELMKKRLSVPLHPNFLLRVQVRELESWLLADAKAWSTFLGISESNVPREPDRLDKPKLELVNLVRRCRRKGLREDIVPEEGRPGPVGRGYTTRISEFIDKHWDPHRAAERSPSLKRALDALERARQSPPKLRGR